MILQKETFSQCYLIANKCVGYDKPIEPATLNALYAVAKDCFEEEEFKSITKQVIQECKAYGTTLPLCEWINRRHLRPEIQILIEDMIESIPSIVASMEYDKHAVEHWIDSQFNDVQKKLANELVFHKAITYNKMNGGVLPELREALTNIVMDKPSLYLLEKNENKLLTDK